MMDNVWADVIKDNFKISHPTMLLLLWLTVCMMIYMPHPIDIRKALEVCDNEQVKVC